MWLTSLTSFTGRHPALAARLAEVQEAFSSLLGDGDELIQELASRGLCRDYHLGDASAQRALLESLTGTLQGMHAAVVLATNCRLGCSSCICRMKLFHLVCSRDAVCTCRLDHRPLHTAHQ